MADDFLQGAQIGLGIAREWAQQSARQQELRTQEAYRAMQERQLAAQAQMLAEHARLYKAQRVQEENEQDARKAWGEQLKRAFQEEIDLGVKDPAVAMQTAMVRTIPAYYALDPNGAQKSLAGLANLAAANQTNALTPVKVQATQALADERNTAADLNVTRGDAILTGDATTGKAFAPSNTERVIQEAEKRGIKFTPADLDEAFKVAAGVQPRERMPAPEISKSKFVEKNFENALKREEENPSGPLDGGIFGHFKHPTVKSREAIIKELGDLYDTIYVKPSATLPAPVQTTVPPASGPASTTPNPPVPGYLRIRVKSTGKLGWADPETAKNPDFEIITP